MEINNEMKELLDRTRRIETRLTAYLERQGEPIGNQKPVWDHITNSILVSNMDCSIGMRIPDQTGHRFHGKLDSHSTANWTLIPAQTGR